MAWDWKRALSGAGKGAAAGGTIGSAVPGIGNILGAIGGGITGLLNGARGPKQTAPEQILNEAQNGGGTDGLPNGNSPGQGEQSPGNGNAPDQGEQAPGNGVWEWLFGTPEGVQWMSQLDPQQRSSLQNILRTGQDQLKNPYAGFEPIRQQALGSFFNDIVPQLKEQFQGGGGSNAYSSPVLQSNLSGAGANLSRNLASAQAQFGQNAQSNALQLLQLGQNQHRKGVTSPGTKGAVPGILDKVLPYAGDAFVKWLSTKKEATPTVKTGRENLPSVYPQSPLPR